MTIMLSGLLWLGCSMNSSAEGEPIVGDDQRVWAVAGEADCEDGVDDDGDGLVDCEDGDCAAEDFCYESGCEDSVDNDGDGFIDCVDEDCWGLGICPVVRSTVRGGSLSVHWERNYYREFNFHHERNTSSTSSIYVVGLSEIYGTAEVQLSDSSSGVWCSWGFSSGSFQQRRWRTVETDDWWKYESTYGSSSTVVRAGVWFSEGCPISDLDVLPQSLLPGGGRFFAGDRVRYSGMITAYRANHQASGRGTSSGGRLWSTDSVVWQIPVLRTGEVWTFGE